MTTTNTNTIAYQIDTAIDAAAFARACRHVDIDASNPERKLDYWLVRVPAANTELADELYTTPAYWRGHYTVTIPPAVAGTDWHSETETLTRGAFETEAEANKWAEAHLNGALYWATYVPGM